MQARNYSSGEVMGQQVNSFKIQMQREGHMIYMCKFGERFHLYQTLPTCHGREEQDTLEKRREAPFYVRSLRPA